MNKIFIIQLLLIFIGSYSCGQNENITAEEIWQNYLDSCGNREEILKIKSYSATIISESKYGESRVVIKTKYPDKFYTEILYPNDASVTYIINGDSGIIKSPKGIENIPQSDLIKYKDSDLFLPELFFLDLGYSIKLVGDDIIRGRECYKLEIDKPYEKIYYLIDKKNFQVRRTINDEYITDILETYKTGSIKLVKTSKSISATDTMTGNYIEQKLNIEIDDKIFNLE